MTRFTLSFILDEIVESLVWGLAGYGAFRLFGGRDRQWYKGALIVWVVTFTIDAARSLAQDMLLAEALRDPRFDAMRGLWLSSALFNAFLAVGGFVLWRALLRGRTVTAGASRDAMSASR